MKHMQRFGLLPLALVLAGIAAAPAHADSDLPQIGGNGGAYYRERCPQGQILNGFELRAGDDIDAIRALCVTPSSATEVDIPPLSKGFGGGWHGGGGGSLERLLCPAATPVVIGLRAGYDGIDTISLDTIGIYCGQVSASALMSQYPSNQFSAPIQGCTHGPWVAFPAYESVKDLVFGDGRCPDYRVGRHKCPAGEIAVGLHGHSGALVDAMGLICGTAPIFRPSVPAMGHTDTESKLTPLQKALRNAKVRSAPNASARASTVSLNPQPLPPGKLGDIKISRGSTSDTSRRAVIGVHAKPQPESKSVPTVYDKLGGDGGDGDDGDDGD